MISFILVFSILKSVGKLGIILSLSSEITSIECNKVPQVFTEILPIMLLMGCSLYSPFVLPCIRNS